MTRWIAVLLAVVGVSGSAEVLAQDAAPGPSTVVITNREHRKSPSGNSVSYRRGNTIQLKG